ncbi:MAG: TetR/AcrR family transcriptional regulator [Thermoleophilaceae bacterium]|nr:TetR/AcrR family transcriptional regulator [Thermoleophilaceae bacterium]
MTEPINTREKILQAASACFLEDGYEHTSVARIRERSGVSNGALFHHFPSKDAILGALYVDAIGSAQRSLYAVLARKPDTLRQTIRGVIESILRWTVKHPDDAQLVYSIGHLERDSPAREELDAQNRQLMDAVNETLAPFVESGELRRMPNLALISVVTGPAHHICQYWLIDRENMPEPIGLLDVLTDAAVAGITGTPAEGTGAQPARRGRVTVELVDADGNPAGGGSAQIELEER